jgi:hypothetical protein
MRKWAIALVLVLALVLGFLGFGARVAREMVAAKIRSAAADRGLAARWSALTVSLPGEVAVSHLLLAQASGDTAFRADSLNVVIDPWSLLILKPRVRALALMHASVRLHGSAADADTLAPEDQGPKAAARRARSQRLRRSAENLVRLLLAPARESPRVTLRGVTIYSGGSDETLVSNLTLSWLAIVPSASGVHLASRGSITTDRRVPFELMLDYGHDDRITGGARFLIPGADRGRADPLRLAIDGRAVQDRATGRVELEDGTKLTIGKITLQLSGSVARDGPSVRFKLAADRLDEARIVKSVPRAVLGPLTGLAVHGSFDYRAGLDLDLSRPDSVQLFADVIPHALALDPAETQLPILAIDHPFMAIVHLPHGVMATREISPANPHFRPLDQIDSTLVHAVLTNEDGGFFRHRGFNVEAVKKAIAENVKAGAYRRGAGTVTMQLVRNLFLGHERTLSRKTQEVVLAWTLENLTGISKRRLLEIYLNIIEWGPGVLGADEAAHYYFDRDAAHLSVSEALFLATVIPAPSRWRYRFGPDGELRHYARAQMYFIGRAMIARGWLAPEDLPARDQIEVRITGPARNALFPQETARAPESI